MRRDRYTLCTFARVELWISAHVCTSEIVRVGARTTTVDEPRNVVEYGRSTYVFYDYRYHYEDGGGQLKKYTTSGLSSGERRVVGQKWGRSELGVTWNTV